MRLTKVQDNAFAMKARLNEAPYRFVVLMSCIRGEKYKFHFRKTDRSSENSKYVQRLYI